MICNYKNDGPSTKMATNWQRRLIMAMVVMMVTLLCQEVNPCCYDTGLRMSNPLVAETIATDHGMGKDCYSTDTTRCYYYYGARYYDPELGRFISVDAAGDNYVYCGNNPVNRIDPSGNSWVSGINQKLGGQELHRRSWDEISSLGVKGNLEHMWNMLTDHNDSPLIAGTLDAGVLIGSLAIPLGNAAKLSPLVKVRGTALATKAGASERTAGFIGTALQNMENSAVLSGYLQYTIEGRIDAKDVFVDSLLGGATSKGLRTAKKGEHLSGVLKPIEPYVQKLARSNIYRKYIGRGNNIYQNQIDIRSFVKGSYMEAIITPIREVLVNDRAPTLDTVYAYGLGRIFGFGAINVGHLYQESITMGRTYNKFLKEPAKIYFMQD